MGAARTSLSRCRCKAAGLPMRLSWAASDSTIPSGGPPTKFASSAPARDGKCATTAAHWFAWSMISTWWRITPSSLSQATRWRWVFCVSKSRLIPTQRHSPCRQRVPKLLRRHHRILIHVPVQRPQRSRMQSSSTFVIWPSSLHFPVPSNLRRPLRWTIHSACLALPAPRHVRLVIHWPN